MTTGRAIRTPGVAVAGWRAFRVLHRITKFGVGEPRVEPFNLTVVAASAPTAVEVAEHLARRAGANVIDLGGVLDLGPIEAMSTRAAREAARLTEPLPEGPRVIT